jgi:hypothetical protein
MTCKNSTEASRVLQSQGGREHKENPTQAEAHNLHVEEDQVSSAVPDSVSMMMDDGRRRTWSSISNFLMAELKLERMSAVGYSRYFLYIMRCGKNSRERINLPKSLYTVP